MSNVYERALLTQAGWDTNLVYESVDSAPPTPTGDEVLVAVNACGVCYRDLIDRAGRFPFQRFPIVPGHEASGRVIAIGNKVLEWKVGDYVGTMHRNSCGECDRCKTGETSMCQAGMSVFGILVDGGYSSHLIAPERSLFRIPDSIPDIESASMHCTFGTAFRDLITLGKLKVGERVLITGANGGVGSAAIQIAKRVGAEVVAVIRDTRHKDYVESLGADRVVIDEKAAFHKSSSASGIDLVLEAVGASTFHASLRTLKMGGRMVVIGNISTDRPEVNLGYIITNGLSIIGGTGATRSDMEALFKLHEVNPMKTTVDRVFTLRDADKAQRAVNAGGLHGRVVVVPQSRK